ncbi:MAG: GGDEF domain-containing protein [Oscillospiraceae bacterium]|nr:GGDEF domain-containing protein [Oscillospiraceae bacterium]
MRRERAKQNTGLRLRTVYFLLVLLVVGASAVWFYTTVRVAEVYREVVQASDTFIKSRESAEEMREGSDELTENVRSFVATGNTMYLWEYFETANVSKKRTNALNALDELTSNPKAYKALQTAMHTSIELMVRELYAMKLAATANGSDTSLYPIAVQRVRLSWQDTLLSPEEMREKAIASLFDEEYHQKKELIISNSKLCEEDLQKETNRLQEEASSRFERVLSWQRNIFFWILFLMLSALLFTWLMLVKPLQRGVLRIRSKLPILNEGSREFRILANAYNAMFDENRQRTGQLTYDATHDSLTTLYNRNGYDFLCKYVDFQSSAMLLIDIDDFKDINDTYGHAVGDTVLRFVADTLKANFRFSDLICRLGGDEFTVIMRKTGPVYKEMIGKKIETINKALQEPETGLPPTSISVGVVFGRDGHSAQSMYELADQALYSVKNNGKKSCEFCV